ncbi:endonuclease/exonuclease/phosphatase family metal-dependent hydrolase [Anaerosolibacter carboniphilus]|uniref:Endonuclease/exonuclease/phosphatase family metal-dependent hydrolase n=2 Tax=Anaerosolibacter carboniphilus TaxID=1417629 RepID=A0A841KP20_9FIRM|nr:endonuclease/exonuclease/phosphatase family metal-dependent hydrolase [Anaerosolibacter carboniphilus]
MEYGNNKIRIMSYNIHSGKDLFMLPSLDKIIHFIKEEDCQIIGIQEINENNRRGYQVSRMKQRLRMNSAFAPNVKIGDGYYGIGIFTPYKILQTNHIPLPSTKEQRGLLDVTLLINHQRLHVMNTHLGLSREEREKQIEKIQKYISSIKEPFLFMGDLNTAVTGWSSHQMVDTGKACQQEHLSTLLCYNKRIDYIFVSKSIKVLNYQVVPVKLSDHYPIMAEIII